MGAAGRLGVLLSFGRFVVLLVCFLIVFFFFMCVFLFLFDDGVGWGGMLTFMFMLTLMMLC